MKRNMFLLLAGVLVAACEVLGGGAGGAGGADAGASQDCYQNSDCGDGEYCTGGRCEPLCEDDSGCLIGEVCINSQCRLPDGNQQMPANFDNHNWVDNNEERNPAGLGAAGRWSRPLITWRLDSHPEGITRDQAVQTIRRAFATWEAHAAIRFAETEALPDIEFGMEDIPNDHGHCGQGTVAHAFYLNPTMDPNIVNCPHGHIHFQHGYWWSLDPFPVVGRALQYDFETVVLHEIGHPLGLGHNTVDEESIMVQGGYRGVRRDLAAPDIARIQDLYGPPNDAVVVDVRPGSAVRGSGDAFIQTGAGFTRQSTATCFWRNAWGENSYQQEVRVDGTFYNRYAPSAGAGLGRNDWWCVDARTGQRSNVLSYTILPNHPQVDIEEPRVVRRGSGDALIERGSDFTPGSVATCKWQDHAHRNAPPGEYRQDVEIDGTFINRFEPPADFSAATFDWWCVDTDRNLESRRIEFTILP